MSTTEISGIAASSAIPELSFKQRLAARRKQLTEKTVIQIPVNGYDDLWARYNVLGYEEIRNIGIRIANEYDDPVTIERLSAAETLAEACVELLEQKGNDSEGSPIFESTGYKWGAPAARELFNVGGLPEGVIAREAITAIFPYPRDILMMTHFEDYLSEGMAYIPELEKVLLGESKGASAPTTSGSSQPPQQ